MLNAFLIAKREYLERIRSRAYRISTVVIPLAFAAIFGIGALSSQLTGGTRHIVVASNDPLLAESAEAELAAPQVQIDVHSPVSEQDLKTWNAQVEEKTIDGYLWLNVQPGSSRPEATYVSRGSADFIGNDKMREAIGHALAREALRKRGMSDSALDDLLKDVDLETKQVKHGEVVASDAGKGFWGAYLMAFLLYFAVVFYGINVAQSVVAEKTSRVFEVLLATAKPEALMAGKLLGVGAAGLTQMAIWIGSLLLFSAPSLSARLGEGGLAAYGVTAQRLIFFFIYFLLGFFFYGALSAGFGATVSQESEVQQFNMILVMPQIIGLVLIVYILGNPAAWQVVLLSLFPPCTPIVMCLRMAAMAVPWWQLGLSLLVMVSAIWGILWFASRLYRVGILMYGKRPTLPEMLRWLRYS